MVRSVGEYIVTNIRMIDNDRKGIAEYTGWDFEPTAFLAFRDQSVIFLYFLDGFDTMRELMSVVDIK